MRAIMSGDSGPPRSETNTNGHVLSALSLRSADTSSRSSVCTVSTDPFRRCTWNVLGPEPAKVEVRPPSVSGFAGAQPVAVDQPQQALVLQRLAPRPAASFASARITEATVPTTRRFHFSALTGGISEVKASRHFFAHFLRW
jgi:hypothetical protein